MDDIGSRIERGKKAIELAREQGMDTASWEKELAGLEALARLRMLRDVPVSS